MGGVCRKNNNTGIVSFRTNESTAKIFAHEVVHSFGADHDGINGCSDIGFIMSPVAFDPFHYPALKWTFSHCSVSEMRLLFRSFGLGWHQDCFVNASRTKPLEINICGNDVIESDEECDGSKDQVSNFEDFEKRAKAYFLRFFLVFSRVYEGFSPSTCS